jgi:iron complex outermembrane receptor protein
MSSRLVTATVAIAHAITPPIAFADDVSEQVQVEQIDEIEELSLETLLERPVVAASRVEQRPGDSPTAVSVISGDEITRFHVRDVGGALARMRGAYSTDDRNYSYIGIRGFSIPGDYNTRVLLAIGDHTASDPVYGQASSGAELGLPIAAIDRVELVRGSASSVYGSSAMLGAVHVVTHTGASKPGLHVSTTTTVTAETYDDPADRPAIGFYGQDIDATYGVVHGDTDVFAAASYLRAPGMRAIYTAELDGSADTCVDARQQIVACDGVVRGVDDEEAASGYLNLQHRALRLSALVSTRTKQVPTGAFDTVIGDRENRSVDSHAFVDAGYHYAAGEIEGDTSVAWDYYDYDGTYVYYEPPADGDPDYAAGRAPVHDAATAHWVTGKGRLRWRRERLMPGVSDADVMIGAEVVDVPTAHQITTTDERDDRELQGALFGQSEARLFDRVVGSAGARIDLRPESFGSNVSPRVGALVDAWHDGRIRVTWGAAFRAPNLYERYYYSAQSARPALRPERGATIEASVEQYAGDNVRVIVGAYRQRLRDLIAIAELPVTGDVVGDNYVFENRGDATGTGVEAEVEARWRDTQLRASLALQRTQDENRMTLPNSPGSLAHLSLVTPVLRGRARLSIASSFVGRRNSAGGVAIDPSFTTDVAIDVPRVAGELDLGAGITNVFDQRSAAPGSEEHRQSAIPQDPRQVWIRIGTRL